MVRRPRHAPDSVDTCGTAARSLPFRLLHAGQIGVDALDRGVRLVEVHLDDEFELIVWQNGSLLFLLPSAGPGWHGITYDVSNNSLWVSPSAAASATRTTMSGTSISLARC
jgi:hypothetical protein